MAVITTALVEFSDEKDKRTFVLPGHTALKPQMLIQSRRVAASPLASAHNRFQVVYGTVDSAGLPVSGRVAFDLDVRFPASGVAADQTAALAFFRELVASDEFAAAVTGQLYVK